MSSNPFLNPAKVFMYTLQPKRLAVMVEGPTPEEAAIVKRHWAHLLDLQSKGTLIFCGRTLITTNESFAHVIFHAASPEEAREIAQSDPAVHEGLMNMRVYPYQAMLMGSLQQKEAAANIVE